MDTKTLPENYDAIFTGDLGEVGSSVLYELLMKNGIDIKKIHNDCGLMIYDRENQDVHAGGSGCGCSASVLCSEILNSVSAARLKNILFIATGAMLSATSAEQSQTIPSIAHLINIRRRDST